MPILSTLYITGKLDFDILRTHLLRSKQSQPQSHRVNRPLKQVTYIRDLLAFWTFVMWYCCLISKEILRVIYLLNKLVIFLLGLLFSFFYQYVSEGGGGFLPGVGMSAPLGVCLGGVYLTGRLLGGGQNDTPLWKQCLAPNFVCEL